MSRRWTVIIIIFVLISLVKLFSLTFIKSSLLDRCKGSRPSSQRMQTANDLTLALVEDSVHPLEKDVFKEGIELVRRMAWQAWDQYQKHAWESDELVPSDRIGVNSFTDEPLVSTMIGALDTLLLLGMENEYVEARDYILSYVSFSRNLTISTRKAAGELMGGLLGAYALSGDGRLVEKALELGKHLLLNHQEMLPLPRIQLLHEEKDRLEDQKPTLPKSAMLAEIGTIGLDLIQLSQVTQDKRFKEAALQAIDRITGMNFTIPGLYPKQIELQSDSSQNCTSFTLGHAAGGFYEYLIKSSLLLCNNYKHITQLATDISTEIQTKYFKSNGKEEYLVSFSSANRMVKEQDQTACFSLAAVALVEFSTRRKTEKLWERLEGQAATCMEQFRKMAKMQTKSGLLANSELMRPRIVESLFVLWRLSRKAIYRQWGLEIAKLIEKHWWIDDHGYQVPPTGTQPAYLLSDTFKFLYLLFSSPELLPIDSWVFNHYGHPYPINFIDHVPVANPDPPVVLDVAPIAPKRRNVKVVRIKVARRRVAH